MCGVVSYVQMINDSSIPALSPQLASSPLLSPNNRRMSLSSPSPRAGSSPALSGASRFSFSAAHQSPGASLFATASVLPLPLALKVTLLLVGCAHYKKYDAKNMCLDHLATQLSPANLQSFNNLIAHLFGGARICYTRSMQTKVGYLWPNTVSLPSLILYFA